MKIEKRNGVSASALKAKYAELEEVKVPRELEALKYHFSALSNTRPEGVSGPGPITYIELKSYVELMDADLTPWEIETIRLMDVAFINEANKLAKERNEHH